MHYSRHQSDNLPIGSGVTEAACKTLVKQRLCHSGMRWKEAGAQAVLSLRGLTHTHTRMLIGINFGVSSINMDLI